MEMFTSYDSLQLAYICVPARDDRIMDFYYLILSWFWKMISFIRSESCFGWNGTIRIRKLSESVLRCTTYISVLCLFCLLGKIPVGAMLPLAEYDWLK